ncbi:MAG: hypothetical protein R3B59_00930 [Dehalococcoidia bacterium]
MRAKVAGFDLAYFFDAVLTNPDERRRYRDESDLEQLDDWKLVQGCRDTGIISDIGYRHLDYIRDMRNHVSAAHPNQNEVTGLQLASWLETCVIEVLTREPEQPVVETRRLIRNIRDQAFDASQVPFVEDALTRLPRELRDSLLRTIFGMYTDIDLTAQSRSNIQFVAPAIWSHADSEIRQETAVRFATLQANGDMERARLAREFLERVGGFVELPESTLAIEISNAIDSLYNAHRGFNNFYNEPAPARTLRARVPLTGAVPAAVAQRYVKVVVMCYVGNGYGVSSSALPIYEALVQMFRETELVRVAALPTDAEFASRLQSSQAARRYRELCVRLSARAAGQATKAILDHLAAMPESALSAVGSVTRYRQLLQATGWR